MFLLSLHVFLLSCKTTHKRYKNSREVAYSIFHAVFLLQIFKCLAVVQQTFVRNGEQKS